MQLSNKGLDNSDTNNISDFSRVASTSFNLTKTTNNVENYDLIYPVLSHNTNNIFDSGSSNPNSKKKLGSQSKSPYNVHSKKKQNIGSSKKRSIESDWKEISTNLSITNQSDPRYKGKQSLTKQSEIAARAQIVNSKNERSCRLPFDSYLNEESKRSKDHSAKGGASVIHPENITDMLIHKFDYTEAQRMNMGSSNYTNDTFETDQNNISFFIRKIKEQEALIDEYKAKEVKYKDKIYNLEKDLRDANHKLEISKFEHEREITGLNK